MSGALADRISTSAPADTVEITADRASCIVDRSLRLGGRAAQAALDRSPSMRDLQGDSGRAVAQAFEGCMQTPFVDVYGYEP